VAHDQDLQRWRDEKRTAHIGVDGQRLESACDIPMLCGRIGQVFGEPTANSLLRGFGHVASLHSNVGVKGARVSRVAPSTPR
jgi:hypothetical protein